MAQILQTATRPDRPLGVRVSPNFTEWHSGSGELRVFVLHTSAEWTRAALAAVAARTRDLGARVTLVAVQTVPFPLPLDRPDVAPGFLEQELKVLAHGIDAPVDVCVLIARDREVSIEQAIPPRSMVVFAAKKRWWQTSHQRLARRLARTGHSVTLLEV